MKRNRKPPPEKRLRVPMHAYPTSIIFPLEMITALKRECLRRGDMPLGTLVKLILAEWLNAQVRPRRGRKPKIETETEGNGS